jgi:hypothetical protein
LQVVLSLWNVRNVGLNLIPVISVILVVYIIDPLIFVFFSVLNQ